MEATITINNKHFKADLNKPMSIGLSLRKQNNPNCYSTKPLAMKPVESAGFVGSIADGGSVNHMSFTIAPHGNGTHTECSGHIYDNGRTIEETMGTFHLHGQVISVTPKKLDGNTFISAEQIDQEEIHPGIKALIIRSLPNDPGKQSRNYSGTNPPFIQDNAMQKIVEMGIEHLIVDLPSVDPEIDGGKLKAHKIFWSSDYRENYCTITELAYIPDNIVDGVYLLNLQVLKIELDASPSNPVLYSLKPI